MLTLDIFDPLLRYSFFEHTDDCLLKHEDEAVPILSAQVITILLGSSTSVQIPVPALKIYFTWLCTLCQKQQTTMQDLAVQYFAGALRTSRNRLVFWNPELNCSIQVVNLLKTKKDLQLQYHTLLVVWLITFEKKIARELNKYFPCPSLNIENTISSLFSSTFPKQQSKKRLTVSSLEYSGYPSQSTGNNKNRISSTMPPRRIYQPWSLQNSYNSQKRSRAENGQTKRFQKISFSSMTNFKQVLIN